MRGPFLAFLMLLGLSTPVAADIVTFRDAEHSIAFSYDGKLWQQSDQANPQILIWIERRLSRRQAGGDLPAESDPIILCNRYRGPRA